MDSKFVKMLEHTCKRCTHVWPSKLVCPQQCPKCHSPYWYKDRRAVGDKGRNFYGFDKLKLHEILWFPWFRLPDGTLDEKMNGRRVHALGQYMTRHGYEYICTPDAKQGLGIYRTK